MKKSEVIYIGDSSLGSGTYPPDHTMHDCDCCLKTVGYHNLYKLPFLYCDYNDDTHPDMGHKYRQYYVCQTCWKNLEDNGKV